MNEHGRAPVSASMQIELVQDGAGISTGAVFAVSEGRACMVWSPTWRSPVPEDQRLTHLGVVGQSCCLGWSEAAGPAPVLLQPRSLGFAESPDLLAVQAVLLANAVPLRMVVEPAPPARRDGPVRLRVV